MLCPACGGSTRTVQTIPADKRTDKRVYRYRRCTDPACGATHSTLEIMHSERNQDIEEPEPEVAQVIQAPPPPPTATKQPAIPMAQLAARLYDLEGELERGLPDAVECIIDAVRPGTSPDRVKLDTAKWLIADRRTWRIKSAEQAAQNDQTFEDPAMAQLANILRLVPDSLPQEDEVAH